MSQDKRKRADADGFDVALPPVLAEANALGDAFYDYEKGVDFEPLEQFRSHSETESWIRGWTDNNELSGHDYRIFGETGTGGVAALWMKRQGHSLEDQPIVFFDSEGQVGVVARNIWDYLWVLAGGYGPNEAHSLEGEEEDVEASEEATALANRHAAPYKKTAFEAVSAARQEFPSFQEDIEALCRH
jgi:hypothetical protein